MFRAEVFRTMGVVCWTSGFGRNVEGTAVLIIAKSSLLRQENRIAMMNNDAAMRCSLSGSLSISSGVKAGLKIPHVGALHTSLVSNAKEGTNRA